MKIKITLDIDKDTDKLVIKNKLIEWLNENFIQGRSAEINIEEVKNEKQFNV